MDLSLKYNEKELRELIREHYPNTTANMLAIVTGLPVGKIYRIAYSLRLKKSPEFQAQLLQIEAERLRRVGAKSRFKKGQTPLNKGKKMSPEVYKKVKRTMFTRGHKPHNTKHDGHISVRRDKTGRDYAYIRVREGEYRLLHRVVWEENNGPIPKGYIVAFKTDNTLDCTPDNLELITREENMRRNSIYNRYPADLVAAIRTNAGLKRRIGKLEERW